MSRARVVLTMMSVVMLASAVYTHASPIPADPTMLMMTKLSATSVGLTWTDTSTDETGFNVNRSLMPSGVFNTIAALPMNSTSYTNTGLTASTNYYYLVRSYNASGESDSGLPIVSFATATSSAAENVGVAQVWLILSHRPVSSAAVTWKVTAGVAGPADFSPNQGSVVFGANETAEPIILSITDDNIYEGNEDVVMILLVPTNATVGEPAGHTFTIVDNEGTPVIQFALTSSSGLESVTPVNIAVTTTSTLPGYGITVDYAVTGGTAMGGGVDYALVDGTLTFFPGETSKNITISIINDVIVEPNETIVLTLSNPTSGGSPVPVSLGSRTVHTYTIINND